MVAKDLLLKVLQAAIIIPVALLLMANPGSKSAGPQTEPGFSAGSWGGSPSMAAEFRYGMLDAASGWLKYHCDTVAVGQPGYPGVVTNDSFPGGAQEIVNTPYKTLHAFWFLVSHHFATDSCGFTYDPTEWGALQATRFYDYVNWAGYADDVSNWFGDVELLAGEQPCLLDPAEWLCDPGEVNVQVIRAFTDTLYALTGTKSMVGIYSSPGNWGPITQSKGVPPIPTPSSAATATDVGTPKLWMASFNPSQSFLDDQLLEFADLGFRIWAWQYTTNTMPTPIPVGPLVCEMSLAEAKTLAENTAVFIGKLDMWTNSRPDFVCPQ